MAYNKIRPTDWMYYTNNSDSLFRSYFHNLHWQTMTDQALLDKAWNVFQDLLLKLHNQHIPKQPTNN